MSQIDTNVLFYLFLLIMMVVKMAATTELI